MILTAELLKKAVPGIAPVRAVEVAANLNSAFAHFKVETPRQIAMFLANAAHESKSFAVTEENLNYTAKRLTEVWPKIFPASIAASYGGNPQAIANRAYANRMGNGNEASGDGWKNRGSGFFQTTGAINHKRAAKAFGKDPAVIGEWLRTPAGAAWGAVLYWHDNSFNTIANKPDIWRGNIGEKFTGLSPFEYICVAINGGRIGLADRQSKYEVAKKALGV